MRPVRPLPNSSAVLYSAVTCGVRNFLQDSQCAALWLDLSAKFCPVEEKRWCKFAPSFLFPQTVYFCGSQFSLKMCPPCVRGGVRLDFVSSLLSPFIPVFVVFVNCCFLRSKEIGSLVGSRAIRKVVTPPPVVLCFRSGTLGRAAWFFASDDFTYITCSELSDFLFGITQPKDCGSSCLSLTSDIKSRWNHLAAVRCPNWQKECDGTYVAAWKGGGKDVSSSRGW